MAPVSTEAAPAADGAKLIGSTNVVSSLSAGSGMTAASTWAAPAADGAERGVPPPVAPARGVESLRRGVAIGAPRPTGVSVVIAMPDGVSVG